MYPQFDPIWPWPWVVAAAGLSLLVVIRTYRQRIAHLAPGPRKILMALRIFTWAILTVAMLRPWIEITEIDRHASAFIVAVDNSRSMSVKDGLAGATRREEALKLLADVKKELEAIGKEIEIKFVDFSKEVTEVENYALETPGEQTAIGHLEDALPKLVPGKKLVGVVLISDGAQRALPPYDTDPRAAAHRLAEQQIPVHTVGIGSSQISDTALDLAVEDPEVSPTVFVKNTVVVRVKVRALGAADQELTVRLLLEDPATAVPGKSGTMHPVATPKKIKPTHNQELIPIDFDFVANDPGEFKLTVEVLPLEGEALLTNNSVTTFLSVLKGGVSVVYFDRQHRPEAKFLKRIDESPDIRLDFKPVREAPGAVRPQMDPAFFEPGKYDVYIIGSVHASVFGPDQLKAIAQAVNRGAGFLMIGGTQSFGPGGYASTPLAEILPVVTLPTEVARGNDAPDPALHFDQPLAMLPTSQGLSHFVMRLESLEKNRKL